MGALRRVAAGLVAAAVIGLVLGAVARVLMRGVALAAGTAESFSWTGSLGICVTFAAVMLPGAVVAAFTGRRLRWALPSAGAAFLCVPGVGVASEEIGHTAGLTLAQWGAVITLGAGVFVIIALLPVCTVRLVDRLTGTRRPRRSHPVRANRMGGRAAPAHHGALTTAVGGSMDPDARPADRDRAE